MTTGPMVLETSELDHSELLLSETLEDSGGEVDEQVSAEIFPSEGRKGRAKSRPAAVRAWMWNGTESLLTLQYTPSGKTHDNALPYLRKRQCMCCMQGGFRGTTCPNCIKNSCTKCEGKPDPKMIIPCFYLRKEDVPYQAKFYGEIDCFLPFCVRREGLGFQTEQDMRVHARTKHKLEYAAHEETLQAHKVDAIEMLQAQVNSLLAAQLKPVVEPVEPILEMEPPQEGPVGPVATLYVSDKLPKTKRARKKAAKK